MKQILCFFLILCLLTGCAPAPAAEPAMTFTDDLGYEVSLYSWERVVSLYGSFGETWYLAGGTLAGSTQDAITERALPLGDEVEIVTDTGAQAAARAVAGEGGLVGAGE